MTVRVKLTSVGAMVSGMMHGYLVFDETTRSFSHLTTTGEARLVKIQSTFPALGVAHCIRQFSPVRALKTLPL